MIHAEGAINGEDCLVNGSIDHNRETLIKQVAEYESKLLELKQAKEHWMLEAQLLQAKYEREVKKVHELETINNKGTSLNSTINSSTSSSSQSPSLSEDKISFNSTTTTVDDDTSQVTVYLRNRISQLIDSLHVADSKAISYQTECTCLQQRLAILENEKKSCESELIATKKNVDDLREELNICVKNYEQQLSVMSEHLATLNEKLMKQRDEIESLKYQKNGKLLGLRKK